MHMVSFVYSMSPIHHVNRRQIILSFPNWWTFTLVSIVHHQLQCQNGHFSTCVFLNMGEVSLRYLAQIWNILGQVHFTPLETVHNLTYLSKIVVLKCSSTTHVWRFPTSLQQLVVSDIYIFLLSGGLKCILSLLSNLTSIFI